MLQETDEHWPRRRRGRQQAKRSPRKVQKKLLRIISPPQSAILCKVVHLRGATRCDQLVKTHIILPSPCDPRGCVTESLFSRVAISRLWCCLHTTRHSFLLSDQWVAFDSGKEAPFVELGRCGSPGLSVHCKVLLGRRARTTHSPPRNHPKF